MIETFGQSAVADFPSPAEAQTGGASWRPRAGNMTPGRTVADDAQAAARNALMLGAQYQNRLIRAVESAIEVSRQDQLHDWLRGPFRMLLPHESVACVELDEHGGVHQVVCLHHHLVDPVTTELIGNPEHGLAVRLARGYRDNRRQSCLVDAGALKTLLARDSLLCDRGLLHNAVIHRVKLLSGAAFRVVLMNVAQDRADCCRHLFKLLSAHLTMALSRAIPPRQQRPARPLSERELEVLRWMGEGKSNREISNILDISALTLKNHVSSLCGKLDVQSREEAVLRGLTSQAFPPLGTM